jgi:N-acylneuraminate cytidylyltransferase
MNIGFIPVRGGSKSIPLKNIKIINGMPLVYWTACAAQGAKCIDKLIIATDSDEIKKTVLGFGFNKLEIFDRDPKNATDTASTESVMLEYIEKAKLSDNDIFFLIQATSPLLQPVFIDGMYSEFCQSGSDSMFTAVREKQFHWEVNHNACNNKNFIEVSPINYDYKKRPRRQDFEGIFAENGACYINTVGNIKSSKCRLSGKIAVYELPSYTAYEIDEPIDWLIIEELMKHY